MKVPPGLGTGPGNRGNPPFEEVRHYFFDMGRDGLLAFFEMPKGAKERGDRNALGAMQHVSFAVSPASQARICKQLEAAKVPYEIGHSLFKSLARAQITGQTVGMLKLLFHRETLAILGVHCFGAQAA